jgi:hypothetical protein
MFTITANLEGHGQTWNDAEEFHKVEFPKNGRLKMELRIQSPQPPKNMARGV